MSPESSHAAPSGAGPRRNLVLGFATAASYDDIRRFLVSLRQCCPASATDVALFVEPQQHSFSQLAADMNTQLLPAVTYWKQVTRSLKLKLVVRLTMRILELIEGGEVFRSQVQHWIHPQAGRYLFYRDYLLTNQHYDLVMLSDTRDVVFQDDPFAGAGGERLADGRLHVFEQDQSLRFGGENVDSAWIPRVYGRDILPRLDGKQTLCSGTTFGGREVMLDYLALMEREALRHRTVPLDQAMHNKIIYQDWPPQRLAVHANLAGPVLTMHGVAGDAYQLGDDGLLRIDGRTVPVLHQYDRIPAVKAAVHRRLSTDPLRHA